MFVLAKCLWNGLSRFLCRLAPSRAARASSSALAFALLAGCGGGGGAAGGAAVVTPAADTGAVAITMTDAPGDFLSYTVDVLRIELHRTNGDVVQTLPLKTRIDFAQLTKVSEFISIASIPAGTYDEVKLVLDYSSAEIVVQDANGNSSPAVVKDASGNALTQLTATLKLADRDKIVISRGAVRNFALDFNLAASNTVTFSPTVVTVSPFLMASAQFDATREHRVRGLLDSVDKTALSVTLKVRPFEHHEDTSFGSLTFKVTDATTYEVDGKAFTGAAGLDAVAALAANTPVVAQGGVAQGAADNRVLTATRVVAGTSVPGNGKDGATGVVISRAGNVLMLKGAHEEDHDGSEHFRSAIEVTVGTDTKVTSALAPDAQLTVSAISVGQLISVRGTVSVVANVNKLDATAGAVRLEPSEAGGDVVATNPLTINLKQLNGIRPAAFDFAGTGSSAANDAKAASYIIDTTGLDLAGIANGGVVRVRGVVNGFGLAPPDFNAGTLIDVAVQDLAAEFDASWRKSGPTKTPFKDASATLITLDLTGAETELEVGDHHDGAGAPQVNALVPTADGSGEFALHTRGTEGVTLLRTFAEAVDAVKAELAAGKSLLRLSAAGKYNRVNAQLTARRIAFEFVPATTN